MQYDLQPDEDWVDEEEEDDPNAEILRCPSCGRDVHEDTQQCLHCGDWITPVYPGAGMKQWIWLVAVLLMLVSMFMIAIR